jgi:hypothetical protein
VVDIDDEWDASRVLQHVLGPPPANVVIQRWKWDNEQQQHVLDTIIGQPTLSSSVPSSVSNQGVSTQVLDRGEVGDSEVKV